MLPLALDQPNAVRGQVTSFRHTSNSRGPTGYTKALKPILGRAQPRLKQLQRKQERLAKYKVIQEGLEEEWAYSEWEDYDSYGGVEPTTICKHTQAWPPPAPDPVWELQMSCRYKTLKEMGVIHEYSIRLAQRRVIYTIELWIVGAEWRMSWDVPGCCVERWHEFEKDGCWEDGCVQLHQAECSEMYEALYPLILLEMSL